MVSGTASSTWKTASWHVGWLLSVLDREIHRFLDARGVPERGPYGHPKYIMGPRRLSGLHPMSKLNQNMRVSLLASLLTHDHVVM
jgi:hypothetical protein